MAEGQRTFRTTISVPISLKARMDMVKESVNWSALACQAFEDKLAEIAARKENKAMIDVIERLRASLRDEQGALFNHGYKVGRKWAENNAAAAELIRLENFHKATNAKSIREWERWFAAQGKHARWVDLVIVIQENEIHGARKAQEFWNIVLGESTHGLNHGDFLQGFAEGAIELWAEVQKAL